MKFQYIEHLSQATQIGIIYLKYSYWDDYSFCTTFTAYYNRTVAERLTEIGTVKIGCSTLQSRVKSNRSQNDYSSYSMKDLFDNSILDSLPPDFFSLGQDISYYKNVNDFFDDNNIEYLKGMNDLAFNFDIFINLYDNRDSCLRNSLLRNLHFSNVEQFNRITKGEAELTEYSFSFYYGAEEKIHIDVIPDSPPPSNIHVLIGRNGVGKTWLLHNIMYRLLENNDVRISSDKSEKYKISENFSIDCPTNSFAGVIGLSFSVFDDALSIDMEIDDDMAKEERLKRIKIDDFDKKYQYIGLVSKNQKDGKTKTKSVDDLSREFNDALKRIKQSRNKIGLYLETCKHLETDPMFSDNGFITLMEGYFNKAEQGLTEIIKNFKRLSSGHMIIILSLTLLAESIYEKTIVLIDEPETHLHPPLLSTYIRTLSFLLIKKNAVAIIATHSPIVLQEVPKNCVTRIERKGSEMHFYDIEIESFATNTDSLTREVFGLEVIKTGFYQLIENELDNNFEKSLRRFDGRVGFLGQILMQSLINKKRGTDEDNQ